MRSATLSRQAAQRPSLVEHQLRKLDPCEPSARRTGRAGARCSVGGDLLMRPSADACASGARSGPRQQPSAPLLAMALLQRFLSLNTSANCRGSSRSVLTLKLGGPCGNALAPALSRAEQVSSNRNSGRCNRGEPPARPALSHRLTRHACARWPDADDHMALDLRRPERNARRGLGLRQAAGQLLLQVGVSTRQPSSSAVAIEACRLRHHAHG
jgi:hypothetical protein